MPQEKSRFKLFIDSRVEKDLESVPAYITKHFLEILDELEKDPINPRAKLDIRPLKDYPKNTYRLRIGDYRVLYSIDMEERQIYVTTIVHRKKAY